MAIDNYFKDQKIDPLTINFDLIRLGAWQYLPEEQEKYPSEIPCELSCREFISDGTVIAKVVVHENANGKAFVDSAQGLATHLRNQLPDLFDKNLARNRGTIWSTLGYFNEEKKKQRIT